MSIRIRLLFPPSLSTRCANFPAPEEQGGFQTHSYPRSNAGRSHQPPGGYTGDSIPGCRESRQVGHPFGGYHAVLRGTSNVADERPGSITRFCAIFSGKRQADALVMAACRSDCAGCAVPVELLSHASSGCRMRDLVPVRVCRLSMGGRCRRAVLHWLGSAPAPPARVRPCQPGLSC